MASDFSTDRLVRTYMVSDSEEEIPELVSNIEAGQTSLLQLVRSLGEYLTSIENPVRSKGVGLLSEVLSRCPKHIVNRQSTRVLTAFFIDKLEDSDVLVPTLRGLMTLATFPHFGAGEAVDVSNGLFTRVKMKAHVQSTRFLVFMVVDALISHQRQALKDQGDDFVAGYIQLAEGEKDPRNLLLAFNIAKVVLTEFNIRGHIDDLFDITFCYFPITFKPPPDDPYGISADDLKLALRSCLHATPLLGPLAMPLFLEKLTATVGTTKRDTLETLTICLPAYGKSSVQPFAKQTWDALRIEIFQPINAETEDLALSTLISLIRTLYPQSCREVDGIAVDISQECLLILREPEKSQAKPAIKVLGAFVEASPVLAQYVLESTLEQLLRLFRDPDELSTRGALLDAMASILRSLRQAVDRATEDNPYEAARYLDPHKDQLLAAFISGLRASTFRQSALAGAFQIARIPDVLTEEERAYLLHNLGEILVGDGAEEIQKKALEIIDKVSKKSPKAVEDTCLPLLFGALPDLAPSQDAEEERAQYWRILTALRALCLQPVLFQVLVIRLVTKLDLICSERSGPSKLDFKDANAAYCHAILDTLYTVISSKVAAGHVDLPKYLDQLVPRLFSIFLRAALVPTYHDEIASAPILISDASKIITVLLQVSSTSDQTRFASFFCLAFHTGDLSPVAYDSSRLPKGVSFLPLEATASPAQQNLIPLYCAAIIPLRKEVTLTDQAAAASVSFLLNWYLNNSTNGMQRASVLRALSTMINKKMEDLSDFLERELPALGQELADTQVSIERRRLLLDAWTWITKSLLVRSDGRASQCVDYLIGLFKDDALAWDAARSVGRLGKGGEDVLTKSNHAVIRILHLQRFFNTIVPRLIDGYKNGPSFDNTTYLAALTSLISHIPKSTYLPLMPEIFPLLLRALALEDPDLRANASDVFKEVIEDSSTASNFVAKHAFTLVQAFLSNAVPSDGKPTNMRLRISSLQSLAALTIAVRYDILHPQKAFVIAELAKAVDDRKRSVRREAVDTRAKWYQYHG